MLRSPAFFSSVLVVLSAVRSLPVEPTTPFQASQQVNAGAVPTEAGISDAVPADVALEGSGQTASCHVAVSGPVTANIDCEIKRYDLPSDRGPDVFLDFVTIGGASSGPSATGTIHCVGKPLLGLQPNWPAERCYVSKLVVSSTSGVNWTGMTGIQGSFAVWVTGVQVRKLSRRDVVDVRGVFHATLPVSNSFALPVVVQGSF